MCKTEVERDGEEREGWGGGSERDECVRGRERGREREVGAICLPEKP